MAYAPLDQAAREAGKSEVTLRRLIKAGKVTHKKETTHTGFIYLVDADEVKQYYQRLAIAQEPQPMREVQSKKVDSEQAQSAGESSGYWRGRAEQYEEKYYGELARTAELREELGQWRGRAEQAQSMLVKLLPSPEKMSNLNIEEEKTEVVTTTAESLKSESGKANTQFSLVVMTVIFAVAFLLFAVGTYYNLRG